LRLNEKVCQPEPRGGAGMAYREVRGWTSIRSSGVGWPARRSEA
jgi:hypothetical protein